MGDGSGVVYTSDDVSALTQELQQIVQEQRVPNGYPSDYLYHQLSGRDGNPVITKIGDEHYAAWLKRDDGQEGAAFTDVVLLNMQQVQEVYGSRPPGNPNVYEATGRDLYINSNLHEDDPNRRIPADKVTRVYYSTDNGQILDDKALAQASRFSSALLPNGLLHDGYVSAQDLQQELAGYRLFPELVAEHTDNDRAKIAYERVVAEDVGLSTQALYNVETYGQAVTYTIEDENIVSRIQFLDFEDGLQPRTYEPEPGLVIIPGQSNNDFAAMMQSVIDSGPEVRDAPNPLAGRETLLLSNNFRAIAGYLAAGPSGEQAAEEAVKNAIRLFPEHRDVIASYALAASQDTKTDPKPYMQEISQRALGGQANDASALSSLHDKGAQATIPPIMLEWANGAEDTLRGQEATNTDVTVLSQGAVRNLAGISDKAAFEKSAAQAVEMFERYGHEMHAQAIEAFAQNPTRDAERETMKRLAELDGIAPVLAGQVVDAFNNPETGSQITLDEARATVEERFNALESSGYFTPEKVDEMMKKSGMNPDDLSDEQKADIVKQAKETLVQNITADRISSMASEAADQALKGMPEQVEAAIASRLSDVKQAIRDHYKPENLQQIYKDAVERKMAESGPAPTVEEMSTKYSAAEQNIINQYVERLRPMAEANPAYLEAMKQQVNGSNPFMDEAVRIISQEMEAGTPAVNPGGGPKGP